MRFLLSDCTLQITPVKVKVTKKNRSFPSTEPEWRTVLQGVFDRLGLQLEGTNEEARAANEKEIFRRALAQNNPVQHCESLLVAYLLLLLRRDSTPPVSYIGVSKLSCKACFLWLKAVREVTGCKFDTQGGRHNNNNNNNNKWYHNWSAPALERSKYKHKIDKNFLEKVESELYKNVNASKIARPRAHSDSSKNASEEGKGKLEVKNGDKKLADLRMSFWSSCGRKWITFPFTPHTTPRRESLMIQRDRDKRRSGFLFFYSNVSFRSGGLVIRSFSIVKFFFWPGGACCNRC